MTVALVDTSVLVASADADDPRHDVATSIVRGIDRGELPTGRVTNYVILETLNWIHGRGRHENAVEFHGRLRESAGFELTHAAQGEFGRAVEFFETYEGLTFGDATIAAHAEQAGVQHLYSFDDDFDALEILTRLASPDDPFEP